MQRNPQEFILNYAVIDLFVNWTRHQFSYWYGLVDGMNHRDQVTSKKNNQKLIEFGCEK